MRRHVTAGPRLGVPCHLVDPKHAVVSPCVQYLDFLFPDRGYRIFLRNIELIHW